MTILLGVLTVTVSTQTISNFVEEVFTGEIAVFTKAFDQNLVSQKIIASNQVKAIAERVDMIEAIKEGNREKVQSIITNFETEQRCSFFTILDAEGKVFFRTSNPAQFGDSLADLRGFREATAKKTSNVYYESTKNLPLSMRAAVPIFDENKNIIGVATGGYRLDTEEWVDQIKNLYNVECTVFVGDTRAATTVRKAGTDERAVGTPLNNPKIHDVVLVQRKPYNGEATVVGRLMKVCYEPVYNEGDDKVLGMFFLGISMENHLALIRSNVWYLTTITIVAVLIFGIILFGIVRAIVIPIRRMAHAAEALADGNLDVDVRVQSKDETAILATAFQHLAESLKAKTEVALAIAGGDLTVWVPLRSQNDVLGMSLIRMRYSLYDSIKGLTGLAKSIGEEAVSLSHVNQALVANTTESAAQLKNVAESISALHSQTKQNADSAHDAEKLTKSAKDGSNDGREKMKHMVEAMDAITKSASEIKNIIKVIDDIAFQTNLLALNAAVEAARAGQHGKGFAVVAEEVRNLASRSAKAARETAGLIEESIRHVGLGSNAAHETSDSLNMITDQVEQISKIVSTISEESGKQVALLGEMTNTVNQVSATADSNTQSVTEVSGVIDSVHTTAQSLDSIVKHFRSNPEGKVMTEGGKYTGFIPTHGTFQHQL